MDLQQNSPEVRIILTRARELSRVRNSSYEGEAETRDRLHAHGIPDELIAKQLGMMKSNTADKAAVLASYSLLHSLQHLDAIEAKSPRQRDSAEAVIALFRCAEIYLYNIGILSAKMVENLREGRTGRAVALARWRSSFQEALYRLSGIIVEVGSDPTPGPFLNLHDSRLYRFYRRHNQALHQFLMTEWQEAESDIFTKGLDDPQRYVFFSEFVNSSDERVWCSRLRRVSLPGAEQMQGEGDAAFYERMICNDEIERMLTALETEADTDLLPFRAVHQVAETLAGCVNRRLCEAIEILLGPPAELDLALRKLLTSNRLLNVVDDGMKLLMRSLTPMAYSEVRPSLGMVRGTSSMMLRKTLFNSTYPLLLRAFKLRICAFSPAVADDDSAVQSRAQDLAAEGSEGHRWSALMEQLVTLHQHVRTWRDNHQQLPKTHLGVSPVADRPIVSLSGSDSAVDVAHELRKVHASDPIAPLYRALLGTNPPEVHELLTPGGFDEHMAHKTAQAVFRVYADVQERFYERRQRNRKTGR